MIFNWAQDAHIQARIRLYWIGWVCGKPVCDARLFANWRSPAKEGCVCAGLADGILRPGSSRHISPVDGKLLRIVQFSSVVIRSDDVELVCASRFYHAVSSRHRQQQVGECKRCPHEATANFAKLKLRVTRAKVTVEIAVRLKYIV